MDLSLIKHDSFQLCQLWHIQRLKSDALNTRGPYRNRASTELERNYKNEEIRLFLNDEQISSAAGNNWNIWSTLKPSSVKQQLLGDCDFHILDFPSLPMTPFSLTVLVLFGLCVNLHLRASSSVVLSPITSPGQQNNRFASQTWSTDVETRPAWKKRTALKSRLTNLQDFYEASKKTIPLTFKTVEQKVCISWILNFEYVIFINVLCKGSVFHNCILKHLLKGIKDPVQVSH